MKKFALIVLLLLVASGGYVAYRAFSGPPQAPRLADLPPDQRAARREDAQKLVGQVNEIARAAKAKERRDFTLVASQDQLNTLLQDNLKIKDAPVSDVSVALQPDSLILSGRADYKGVNVPVVIDGNLKAQDGALSFGINSLTLGGFGAPDSWKQKARVAAEDALKKALSDGQKLRLETVKIESKKLTLRGQTG